MEVKSSSKDLSRSDLASKTEEGLVGPKESTAIFSNELCFLSSRNYTCFYARHYAHRIVYKLLSKCTERF